MAAKKAAKKGDEPVRVGRAKKQTTKGFVRDPYSWTNPSWAKGHPVEKSVNKISKQLNKDVKKLVAEGKQKYGTKFVVSITGDATAELTAGATKKGIKAQSSRMTGQAVSAQTTAAQKKASSGKQTDLAGTAGYGNALLPSAQSGFTGNYFGNIGRTAQRGKDQAKRAAAKPTKAQSARLTAQAKAAKKKK